LEAGTLIKLEKSSQDKKPARFLKTRKYQSPRNALKEISRTGFHDLGPGFFD